MRWRSISLASSIPATPRIPDVDFHAGGDKPREFTGLRHGWNTRRIVRKEWKARWGPARRRRRRVEPGEVAPAFSYFPHGDNPYCRVARSPSYSLSDGWKSGLQQRKIIDMRATGFDEVAVVMSASTRTSQAHDIDDTISLTCSPWELTLVDFCWDHRVLKDCIHRIEQHKDMLDFIIVYEKNGFVEVSKLNLKINFIGYQNN